MKPSVLSGILAGILVVGIGGPVFAEDGSDYVYGSQLMTQQERAEHRAKMRSLATEEEREAYRKEHHERMKARAQERGATLPDEPLPRGAGFRRQGGGGFGPGPGPGGGGGGGGAGPGGGAGR